MRSRIAAFVELGRRTRKNRAGIEAAMRHNLSNALIGSTNTKLRVLYRMAFRFKKLEHLVALALLDRGGYCHPYPERHCLINPRMRRESPKPQPFGVLAHGPCLYSRRLTFSMQRTGFARC